MANRSTSQCSTTDTTQPLSVDFAASDVILEPADYVRNPDLQMYPTVATAVVPVYNLNTANLTLSTAVLAQVFSGQILTWDDPRIVALNPNFSTWRVPAGQRIEVVVWDSGSGITGVFRQALCHFDSVFAQQVGPGTDVVWSGVNVTCSAFPAAYVLVTPYTISYAAYSTAVQYSLATAKLKKSTGMLVEVSSMSTLFAVQELGLTFGNNGDDPNHLTADLSNAKADKAWPIVMYTYLLMRKSAPKPGASCTAVQETAKFWRWFWTSGTADAVARSLHFTPLPDIVKEVVTARFTADITCNGLLSLAMPQPVPVPGSGVDWVAPILQQFALFYSQDDPTVDVSYRSVPLRTEAAVETQLDSDVFVAAHVPWAPTSAHPGVKVVLAGIAVVVISQCNLTLDLPTLAAILNGSITTWLHPDIQRLNNAAIRLSDGTRILDPAQRIVLFNGPAFQDPFLADLLRSYVPTFTGAALAAARYFSSDDLLRAAVAATRYSLGISAMVGSFPNNVLFASLKRPTGVVVAPSWQTVQACATADTYDAATGDYRLETSTRSDCYPLATAVYVAVRKSQCSMATDPQRTAAVAFLAWLLRLPFLGEALQEQLMAPLILLPAVSATNQKALDAIVCPAAAPIDWLPIAIGVGCGGGVALIVGLVGGLWRWKFVSDRRAQQKQSADDKVAQVCAAAIAVFDLESLEWLKAVENPDPIQRSFLQITSLLAEVRPFIPDQLLAFLQRRESESGSASEAAKVVPAAPNPLQPASAGPNDTMALSDGALGVPDRPHPSPHSSPAASVRSDRLQATDPLAKRTPSAISLKGTLPGTLPPLTKSGRRRSPKAAQCMSLSAAATECRRKVAVFMYVHYGFAPGTVSEQEMPQRVTALLADLVTIAKGHGATIDHVVFGSLALHWGVAFSSAQGPLKATTAALEMAQLRERLPAHLQEAMQLRVAVVYGNCDVSTASAAGYRFFVVAGQEVQMAMDVVGQNVMAKVKCEVMITQAVYQEVQYAVECMPRLWFGDVLLYEPQQIRPTNPNRTDEWMYQLQSFEGSEGQQFSVKAYHAVFMLARSGVPPSQVQSEARRMRTAHAAEMTPRDVAALQYLESAMAAEAWSKTGMGVMEVWP
eukprot:EG_transcript_630